MNLYVLFFNDIKSVDKILEAGTVHCKSFKVENFYSSIINSQ